jgi:hypothetical protein
MSDLTGSPVGRLPLVSFCLMAKADPFGRAWGTT